MKLIKFVLIIGLGFYAGYSFAEGTAEKVSETKEAIQKDLEQGIDRLRVQLKDLQAKAEKSTGKAKSEINEKISELKEEESKMQKQVQHVKSASGKAWDDIKKGAKAALENLKKSMNDAKERFKE